MKEEERPAILSESEHFDAYVDSGEFEKDDGIQNYSQGFRDGWNAAIAYAKGERQWVLIRTEADLPKKSGDYLFQVVESGRVFTNFYSTKYSPAEHYASTYAAWMPLPDPYQPKTDGDKAEGE